MAQPPVFVRRQIIEVRDANHRRWACSNSICLAHRCRTAASCIWSLPLFKRGLKAEGRKKVWP